MTEAALVLEAAPEPATLRCPYPGLRPFTEGERGYYFGRDAQRDDCCHRLARHRFLAVVGSSGSGKSSLVRAGLIPALEQGLLRGADERWNHAVLRPGPDPMEALARAVASLVAGSDPEPIRKALRDSSRGLIDAVKLVMSAREATPSTAESTAESSAVLSAPARNVLIVVDQFEELFRLGKERQTPERWRADRVAFVQALLGARDSIDVPIYVVTTMRTDFLEDCTFYPGLPDALNAGQYLVPELTREQLKQAITKPAALLDVKLAPSLVRELLLDASVVRDSLPVVQHALMRTWLHWQDLVKLGKAKPDLIELCHYRDVGSAKEALDRHGDDVLKALGEPCFEAAKLVFQRLTLTNADGKVTRSPTSFENIVKLVSAHGVPDARGVVECVLNAYRAEDCRFLMPPAEESVENAEIDISHEAVFRVWQRLANAAALSPGWIAEEHRNRRTYVRLSEAAQLFGGPEGQLLDGEQLTHVEAWWGSYRPRVEWARRCHVLNAEAQRIEEAAQTAFHELERERRDEPEKRASILEKYSQELMAWHAEQFKRAHEFLKQSVAERQADLDAQKAAQTQLRNAKRNKWLFALAAAALGVLGVVALQRLKLDAQSKELYAQSEKFEKQKAGMAQLDTELGKKNQDVADAQRLKVQAEQGAARAKAEADEIKKAAAVEVDAMRSEAATAIAKEKQQVAVAQGILNGKLAAIKTQNEGLVRVQKENVALQDKLDECRAGASPFGKGSREIKQ